MKNLYFLNHTSFILEHDSYLILADPWSKKLAFNGWITNPGPYLNEDILLSIFNQKNIPGKKRKAILISHGHDDHCDDDFLKKIDNTTPIIIASFTSKGFYKRIQDAGFKDIYEVKPETNLNFGPFKIHSYIIEDHSDDDAIFQIETTKYSIVHANDNSFPWSNSLSNKIKLNAKNKNTKIFMSQTGIANCFPYKYPQFHDKNFNKLVEKKITKTTNIAIKNAEKCKFNKFVSYAAYTTPVTMIKKNGHTDTFLPSPSNLQKLSLIKNSNVEMLDMIPGDSVNLNDCKINKAFWNKFTTEKELRRNTNLNYLLEEKKIKKKNSKVLSNLEITKGVNRYLELYNEYLVNKIIKKKLFKSIVGKKIQIRSECKIIKIDKVLVGKKISKSKPNKVIELSLENLSKLVLGEIDFESLYIGYLGTFYRYPKKIYNSDIISTLQIFGYIYRKRYLK